MRKSLRSLVVAIVSLALTGAAISVAPSASAYAPKPALEVFLAKKKAVLVIRRSHIHWGGA